MVAVFIDLMLQLVKVELILIYIFCILLYKLVNFLLGRYNIID